MDRRLVSWARAVKARRRPGPPPLWLFTDSRRLPDPFPAVRALPPGGISGVIFRHDGNEDRLAVGVALARLCRRRGIALAVAADAALAARLGAGLHLRDGTRPGVRRRPRRKGAFVTSSAHGPAAVRRALHARAELIFISPAFATASHPGARALGPLRWSRLARMARGRAAALGGIDGAALRRLPRHLCAAIGAIGALAP
ncbi:MAG TPA: thiamine phosphate synthase [Acetobacteraceae bacterium]|nr:thiamine phosphate synthase [Acetobacteraceae bacterium]